MSKLGFSLLLVTFVVVPLIDANPINEEKLSEQFAQFKIDFNKLYSSNAEEQYRKRVFAINLEHFQRHNEEVAKGVHSYTVGVHRFADLTRDEIKAINFGFKKNVTLNRQKPSNIDVTKLPKSIDWTTKGAVTSVKNQQDCGSCYAFSSVGSIEGQLAITTGKLVDLSPQQIVDCTKASNNGCHGGTMDNTFDYLISHGGIDADQSYPYEDTDTNKCRFNPKTVAARLSGRTDLPYGDELALQKAVAKNGPISVGIAVLDSWASYKSGVYYDPKCSSTDLRHAVLVVGYGVTENGTEYWKVKNSWGVEFGNQGYILMARNRDNNCGIATIPVYPNLKI